VRDQTTDTEAKKAHQPTGDAEGGAGQVCPRKRFPDVFCELPRPLAIAIHWQIFTAAPELGRTSTRRVLGRWCHTKAYLKAVADWTARQRQVTRRVRMGDKPLNECEGNRHQSCPLVATCVATQPPRHTRQAATD
jgi:hypothetical protein